MYLKPSVRFGNSDFAMACAVVTVNSVFIKAGYEFIITSANDGAHMVNSKHYSNEAFDFRSKHISTNLEKQNILTEIKSRLTGDFDVLLENVGTESEHYHLEHDRK